MDLYTIWFDLRDTSRDVEFTKKLGGFLDELKRRGGIEGWRLTRRKLGFGPHELGEFMVFIECRDLAQLDAAFGAVAPRAQPVEGLHSAAWSQVENFRSGLFRDFPDAVRSRQQP